MPNQETSYSRAQDQSNARSRRRERRKQERRQANLLSKNDRQLSSNTQQGNQLDKPKYPKQKWTENAKLNNKKEFHHKKVKNQTSATKSRRCRAKKYQIKEIKTDDLSLNSSFTDSTCSLTSSEASIESVSVKKKQPKKKMKAKKKAPKKRKETKMTFDCEIPIEERQKYIALDCEMVGVGSDGKDSVLARVSIIDWDYNVLLDTFIRISEPVTDFRTFVSGVRQSDIDSDDAMGLDDCQKIVQDIIKDRIIVGHGLKNDLQALGICHPWYQIRDTTKYEPFMKNGFGVLLPRKLKDLAKEKLGTDIQRDGMEHDPLEDAWAAMVLYKFVRSDWENVMEYKLNKTRDITRQQMLLSMEMLSSQSTIDTVEC